MVEDGSKMYDQSCNIHETDRYSFFGAFNFNSVKLFYYKWQKILLSVITKFSVHFQALRL